MRLTYLLTLPPQPQAIANVQSNFDSVRTGRANPAMLDNIEVEYYGSMDTGPINTRCYPNTWRSCTKELPNSTESGPYGWTYFNEMLGSEDGGAARNLMDMTFDNVVGADLELRAVQGYMREMKRNTP